MYKRLLIFLMLFAVSSVKIFADDTAGDSSISNTSAIVINSGAGTADCTSDVLGASSGTVRFRARMVPNKYTVRYECGVEPGGAGAARGGASAVPGLAPKSQDVFYDGLYDLYTNAGTCSLNGYTFNGWSCDYNLMTGESVSFSDTPNYPLVDGSITDGSSKFKVVGDVTCRATWGVGQYIVSYLPGEHGIQNNETTYTTTAMYGVDYTVKNLSNTGITPENGWHFNADIDWIGDVTSTGAQGSVEQRTYAEGSVFEYKINGNLQLTAQWSPNTGTVLYTCGDSNGTPPNQASIFSGISIGTGRNQFSLPVSADGCVKATNYTLLGWSCDHDMATGAKTIDPATIYSKDSKPQPSTVRISNDGDKIVCDARWGEKSYTLTYDKGEHGEYITDIDTPAPVTVTKPYNTVVNLLRPEDANINAKQGYKFDGWKCGDSSNSGGKSSTDSLLRPGVEYTIAKDVTCFASWSPQNYTVRYESGGGSGNMDSITGTYGMAVPLSQNKFTNEGHFFKGWDCVDEENKKVEVKSSTTNKETNYTIASMPASNVTCTAQWDYYTITYYGCVGGISRCSGENKIELNPYFSDKTTYTKEKEVVYPTKTELNKLKDNYEEFLKYTFEGGWKLKDGRTAGRSTTDGDRSGPLELYTPMQRLYGVSYKCGENEEATEEGKYVSGVSVMTKANDCIKPGYTFKEWGCDNGVGNMTADATFTMPANDVTCTAQWTENTYTITYKPGRAGERVVPGDDEIRNVVYRGTHYAEPDEPELKTLVADTFNIVGYNFDKWLSNNDIETGETTATEYGANVSIAPYNVVGDTEMTATWKPKHYNVTYIVSDYAVVGATEVRDYYDANTGLGGATYDESYSIIDDVVEAVEPNDGYEFVGWTTDSNPSFTTDGVLNNQWNGETVWIRDDDLTVYAAYLPKSHTIRYTCGTDTENNVVGGTPPDTQTVEYDGGYALAEDENECSLSGSSFAGWKCNYNIDNGNKTDVRYLIDTESGNVNKRGLFKVDDDVVCDALWETDTYRVTYDCGEHASTGSSLPTDTKEYYYGEDVIIKDNYIGTDDNKQEACVGVGYVFDGWYCGDSGVKYQKDDTFQIYDDTECVAQWAPAGSIMYYCDRDNLGDYTEEYGRIGKIVAVQDGEDTCCFGEECSFEKWSCDDNNDYEVDDTIQIPDGVINCYADLEVNIEYRVYKVEEDGTIIKFDDEDDFVTSINPKTCRTGNVVSYPNIVLDGYTFEGWFEKYNKSSGAFNNRTLQTPANPKGTIVVHGKLIKNPSVVPCDSNMWLHIGDERMCLYQEKPNGVHLTVLVGNNKYYGIMTQHTENSSLPITGNSKKKMYIEYNGALYNVHDKNAR